MTEEEIALRTKIASLESEAAARLRLDITSIQKGLADLTVTINSMSTQFVGREEFREIKAELDALVLFKSKVTGMLVVLNSLMFIGIPIFTKWLIK